MNPYEYMRKEIDELIKLRVDIIMAGQIDIDRYRYITGEVAGLKLGLRTINEAEEKDHGDD